MPAAPHLYGIEQCDQVRKARAWLRSHAIDVIFHDLRRETLTPHRLDAWLDHVPWEDLLNRRGMTWRALPPLSRSAIQDRPSARAAFLETPMLMKRPILEFGAHVAVGFSDIRYERLFHATL